MNAEKTMFQRDQAQACMFLAFCITLAVFLSVFGTADRTQLESTESAVRLHEKLLRDLDTVIKDNEQALRTAKMALDSLGRH